MKEKLWSFTDSLGSFQSGCAHKFKTLYFPLANERIMSSVSSDLHGDIKSSQGEFLLVPVSRIDLVNLRSSRNFWICIDKNKIWSATGVSKDNRQIIEDDFKLEAGLLWHKITRKNRAIGLKAEILSFVPVQGEPLEVMQVKITNFSRREIKFTPFAAIPLYCRGANNLRDHRHVTSLLQRIVINKFGIISQPTLSFDETGHRKNDAYYFVLGWDDKARAPQCLYPTQEMFCGQAGDLEAPQSVMENLAPDKTTIQGREPMGALRFKEVVLGPGKSKTYIIVLGISKDKQEISRLISKFSHPKKVEKSLAKTKDYWQGIAQRFNLSTQDTNFDNWFRWVSVQPTLRRIFGCSFLPDFDYGKGGRGWRDLWQDCLSLILSDPQKVRPLILNNFSGVRIDGSNATIIGKGSGEFISDRNNISRTWMDHGIWPLLTLDLYLQETGDYKILFKEVPYFKNHQINRAWIITGIRSGELSLR
jgi:cellobiose phosphorylase